MRPALWKAGVAGLVLFILGVAAGVAAIDMLEEDGAATVTLAGTDTVETRATTIVRRRTVTVQETVFPEEVLPNGWGLCTNAPRGYWIGYPSGWYTTHLERAQACEYFDPRPFEIVPGTEFPPTALFATQSDESVEAYVTQLTDPMFFETVRQEDTTVEGRPAVLVQTVATGEGESEPGERTYGYVVDNDGRAFVVLATGLPGDRRFSTFKKVADNAVKTVRFL